MQKATSIQIRDNLKRTGNSYRKYIRELEKSNCIEQKEESRPKEYILTRNGKEVLDNNRIYLY